MIIILLLAAIFGFVLTTTLFFKKSVNKVATRILGSFYFLLSVYALQAFIIDGGYLEHFQWFFLWPLLPYNLIFIPIYYYFKVILTDHLSFDKTELILLVPFLLGLIDVTYVYLQPESVYQNIISGAISNPETRLNAEYLLLSLDQHLLMRHLWQLGVLVTIIPEIRFFIKNGDNNELKNILNKWLLIFWGILMIMALLAIIYALEKMMLVEIFDSLIIIGKNGGIITLLLYIALFLIGIIPIYFPSILYGYPQRQRPDANFILHEETEGLKFGLEKEEVLVKLKRLKENNCHLDKNFNLSECAKKLDMPSHHISYFLKQYYGISFAAYKNTLRTEHARNLIEQGYLENNTIDALAEECGYATRTSFSKAFKNVAEMSPSQYALDYK
ncbi:transcriptional regulator, AraC family [Salegentibacter agarivorans]|uniref:Transcriptional regulator, AraC family n=1 Tax=Salegentibacter agarivorans TaxID=345907 RepID=A0A1I2Q1I5_9FLAO|nr:AraC family transcriptional regulator [Salegentibacter agarivorans]SFG22222.1 transcriptional regulator, AraC family [Salegentibacter agarivorans]